MGFSVVFIFALLQICTLCDGGNSEDLSNITDSSNHPHHRHPRGLFNRRSAEKEEEPRVFNHYLVLVVSKDPPEDAVQVTHNNDDYYILQIRIYNNVTVKALQSSEMNQSTNEEERTFLVNKDNFEILEWKKWADVKNSQIPFHPIIIFEGHYITKDNNGISLMTRGSLIKSSKVLTVNYDIKGQDFQIDNCEDKKKVKADKIEVIKRFTAENKNCKPAKHVVKFDQGNDISRAFLKSRTHTVGGEMEASASGTILGLVAIGGKVSGKYDYGHLNSETTSNLDKVLHSVSMEIEIPPNHSCTIEIKRKTSTVEAQCSGLLFRHYKNGGDRTTSVTGVYNQEEVAELLTSMNP
ncbi:hypothetical protein PO909_007435 [Leuciscus waleckii]